jgi:hypothetical protein
MPIGWGMAAMAGASLIGGAMQAKGARDAAQTQADQAARSQQAVLAAGQQGAEQYAPYTAYGQTALSALGNNMPYFQQQFTNQDLNANLAPNYGFQLQQGQGANLSAANATGGTSSGNALKSLQDYTQGFAGNAYQNAFNNFQGQRTNIYNQLMGGSQLGLQGATGAANALIGTGTNVANIGTGNANAQAASQIAQSNAYGGAIQNIGNLTYLSSLGKGQTLNTAPSNGSSFISPDVAVA